MGSDTFLAPCGMGAESVKRPVQWRLQVALGSSLPWLETLQPFHSALYWPGPRLLLRGLAPFGLPRTVLGHAS